MFTLRFNMRAPVSGAPAADLYAAAIDMCSWAETRGAVVAVLSEHHATEDGHLPVPHILASAIAARTKHLAILLAAVPITFWDPVRLAEEISILDIISKGRVSYAFGIGHRAEEYEHFGVDLHERGKLADESLALLLRLLKGEPVDHGGRRIHVSLPLQHREARTCSWPEAARRQHGVRRSSVSGSSLKPTHQNSRSSTNRYAVHTDVSPA